MIISQRMDFILLFILLYGMQYVTAENFYVNKGNTVQLSCNTDITYPEWDGPEGTYNYANNPMFNPYLVEKTSRLSWGTNKLDLIISNVKRNDSGSYYCQGILKYLFVRVVPLPPQVMEAQGSTITASDRLILPLTCQSSGGFPESNIVWYKTSSSSSSNALTTTTASVYINSSDTYNITGTHSILPSLSDDGVKFICVTFFKDGPRNAQQKEVTLSLKYPPEVEVITANTSVKATSVILTCHAKGLPDTNYKYGKWIQTWLGYEKPISENPGNKILELTNLTYEHSGIYSCSASNGVKEDGTGSEFIEGSVELLVKSFPIIVNSTGKTAARLEESASFEVIYFSNVAGTNIQIYKTMDGPQTTRVIYNVSESSVKIYLPVFTHRINTIGTKALIIIQMASMENYGYYTVVLTNEIDSSALSFEILQKGPPSDPYIVRVEGIQNNTARLSWIPGYHGGFAQTFVIQLSTDLRSWRNITYDGGQNENDTKQTYVLHDLQYSTRYYVRLCAFNIEGYSNFSQTITFNTPVSSEKESSQDRSTLIIGVVSGLVIVGVVTYAIIATVLLKRNRGMNQTKDDDTTMEGVNQMTINLTSPKKSRSSRKEMKNRSRGNINFTDNTDSETTYTGLDNRLKDKESAYETISSM